MQTGHCNKRYSILQKYFVNNHSTRGERKQVQKNARTKDKSKTNAITWAHT